MTVPSPDVGIASYIRTFELIIVGPPLLSESVDVELWSLLNNFTRVEHLNVSSRDFFLSFQARSSFLSKDFVDLCHSPTLSELTLSNFADVPTHLLRHSHVSHIKLSNVTFVPDPFEQHTFVHQLESIEVDGISFYSIINTLHNDSTDLLLRERKAFSRLRTLEIDLYDTDLQDCLKVAAAAIDSLETLSLHVHANNFKGDPKYFLPSLL